MIPFASYVIFGVLVVSAVMFLLGGVILPGCMIAAVGLWFYCVLAGP